MNVCWENYAENDQNRNNNNCAYTQWNQNGTAEEAVLHLHLKAASNFIGNLFFLSFFLSVISLHLVYFVHLCDLNGQSWFLLLHWSSRPSFRQSKVDVTHVDYGAERINAKVEYKHGKREKKNAPNLIIWWRDQRVMKGIWRRWQWLLLLQ